MEKEFNLSERLEICPEIWTKEVKEFIKRLKAHFTPKEKTFYTYQMFTPKEMNEFIDKLAGEKLR